MSLLGSPFLFLRGLVMSMESIKSLSDLLRWNQEIELKDAEGKSVAKVWIRLVGDLDYQQAQQVSLLASRVMRKKLNDTASVEYKSLFLDIDDREKKDLIMNIVLSEISNYREWAIEEAEKELEKVLELPQDANLEQQEKHQESEEEYQKNRVAAIRKKLDEKADKRTKELEEKPIEEIKDIFIRAAKDEKCMNIFTQTFREFCVYTGTYANSSFSKKAFGSFEEFQNVATSIKRQLLDAYIKLELTGEQLKN